MRVNTVDVRGVKSTQPWVLEKCLQSTLNATNFEELIDGVRKTNMLLSQLDSFSHIAVELDTASTIYGSDAIDVTFVVRV